MTLRPPVVARGAGERPPVAAPARSLAANFRDVVIQPAATFRDVARRPRWLAPLVAVTLASVIVSLLGWPTMARIVRETMPELGPGAPPGLEALTLGSALMAAILGPLFGTPLGISICGVLLWGWARLTGAGGARLDRAVAAIAFVSLIGVFSSVADVVALTLFPEAVDPVAIPVVKPLSLAALFEPGEVTLPLHAALGHVSVFSLWWAALLVVAGTHALGMSRGAAIGFAALAWVAMGVLIALGASLSGLGSAGQLPGAPIAL